MYAFLKPNFSLFVFVFTFIHVYVDLLSLYYLYVIVFTSSFCFPSVIVTHIYLFTITWQFQLLTYLRPAVYQAIFYH